MSLELTSCPDCGHPAEVVDRFLLQSTDGATEHVKTRCITGHWFTTPAGYRSGSGERAQARPSSHSRIET
jgi:hypothetical protein